MERNGNDVFEMLKNMSEEERGKVFFDTVFDFNDFNFIVDEIYSNDLLWEDATDDDYEKIKNIPDDVKKKMINQALIVQFSNSNRDEYIDGIFDYIRSLINNYAKNN